MSPSKKKQLPVRLETDIRARLDQFLARNPRQWKSINAIVNEALDRFLPALDGAAPAAPPAAPPPPAVGPADDDTLDWGD